MYQKIYKNKIGAAKLNIEKAKTGEKINCRLTYRAGIYGIDNSGSIKILFRIVSDFGEFQFDNPNGDNYVKISSSNQAIKFKINSKSYGAEGKIYIRPWSRGFTIILFGDYLNAGEEIYFDFKNWRQQTFCEKTFEFKILADPFATAKYIELPKSPEIKIIPSEPARLVILAPTIAKTGKQFNALIKIEDRWGNPCVYENGFFIIEQNDALKICKNKIAFTNGCVRINIQSCKETLTYIQAKYKGLKTCSNPIIFKKNPLKYQYWADLHAQSEETIGTNTILDYFKFARDYGFLDVASHQGNDFQITKKDWIKINQTTKIFNKENKFITFPGYEWSGNIPNGGDRNVIYKNEGCPIYRSSHALIDDFSDIKTDAPTARDLFKRISNIKESLVIAHVGGRYANLFIHSKDKEKAIEIHSCWGTFEWFLFDALKRNYRIGIVANSDGHNGRPGAEYPGLSHFGNYGGLTCILSKKLTRKNIFQALNNRHTYATTGARIYLDVICYDHQKEVGMIGDIIKCGNDMRLKVSCAGTSAVDRIEVWNKDKIIYTHFPELKASEKAYIKIIWSGSESKGRDRNFLWKGYVKILKNNIKGVEKINFFMLSSFVMQRKNSIKFQGGATGGVQGIIVELEKNAGQIEMDINEAKIIMDIKNLSNIPKAYYMNEFDAKFEVYKVVKNSKPELINFTLNLKELKKGDNPIFTKIIQRDGHLAWSSPIYLIK
ncbi:MAG: DUF3604 domain-containing protein [bacterium]